MVILMAECAVPLVVVAFALLRSLVTVLILSGWWWGTVGGFCRLLLLLSLTLCGGGFSGCVSSLALFAELGR